jgi:histone deacetylase 11
MRIIHRNRCKIVYRHEYFQGIHAQNSHCSFDVMKFRKIRDQLIKDRLIKRKDILSPARISDEDLLIVHTQEYINSLKNPMTVAEILNLDYINPWDDYIFEYFRYSAGGTLLAAEYAMQHNLTIFNLGGGYHHAHPNRGEGFCLINDVAIAIRKSRLPRKIQYALIVDLDYHQGNGNLLYFQNDENVFTFSMHSDNWEEISGKKNNIDIELPSHIQNEMYLKILKKELSAVFSVFQPDIVFYIAGSDAYVEDQIGDFDLNESGMLERDIFIYQESRKRNYPLVVLAGGGYGPESWKIYYNFIKWVIQKGK